MYHPEIQTSYMVHVATISVPNYWGIPSPDRISLWGYRPSTAENGIPRDLNTMKETLLWPGLQNNFIFFPMQSFFLPSYGCVLF